jgi:isoamylase
MIVMGDEYGHTKGGNNNTYCHDNALNYFNWEQAKKDSDGLLRFTKHMISFRKAHKELRRSSYVNDNDVEWHGIIPGEPDWTETSRFLALTFRKPGANAGGVYIAFNTSHTPLLLELPRWEGRVWQPVADTGKAAPYDILVADERLPATEVEAAQAAVAMWTTEHAYPMLPWSCIVLESIPATAVAEMPDERRAELDLGGLSSSSSSSSSAAAAAGKKKSSAGKKTKAAKTGSGSDSE